MRFRRAVMAAICDSTSASALSRLRKQWSTYPLKVRPDLFAAKRIASASSTEQRISRAVRLLFFSMISIDITFPLIAQFGVLFAKDECRKKDDITSSSQTC